MNQTTLTNKAKAVLSAIGTAVGGFIARRAANGTPQASPPGTAILRCHLGVLRLAARQAAERVTEMSAAITNEVAEQRAREMAALDLADRNVRIAVGIISGVVTDGRKRFAATSVGHDGPLAARAGRHTPRCA
jgi:hypothetical protein